MAAAWYVQIDGTVYGPETGEQLRKMARGGRLARSDLVRKGPTGDWVHASRVKGLFDSVGVGSPGQNASSGEGGKRKGGGRPVPFAAIIRTPALLLATGGRIFYWMGRKQPTSPDNPSPVASAAVQTHSRSKSVEIKSSPKPVIPPDQPKAKPAQMPPTPPKEPPLLTANRAAPKEPVEGPSLRDRNSRDAEASVSPEPESAKIAVPELGPPPRLPRMPKDLAWPTSFKKEVEASVASYDKDQVSAYLTFDDLNSRDRKTIPNAPARTWLQKATALTRPRAIEVLRHDFQVAVRDLDLRGALIAQAVAEKVQKGCLDEEKPLLASIKTQLLSGKEIVHPVWRVTEAKGRAIEGVYVEHDLFQGRISVTPGRNVRIVRLRAKAENISNMPDPPYWSWSIGGLKGVFLRGDFISKEGQEQSARRAIDDHIFLVTSGGDLISCSHVCKGCKALLGTISISASKTASKKGSTGIGTWVPKGSGFELDVLFPLPEGIDDVKLLILGSSPTTVELTR